MLIIKKTLANTDTRERLFAVALELFASRGYQAISLRELAAHLGVQVGSLYYHIESKQSLLFEIIECVLNELINLTRIKMKKAVGVDQKLRVFVSLFIRFHFDKPQAMQLLTRECVNLTDENRGEIERLNGIYARLLMGALERDAVSPFNASQFACVLYSALAMLNSSLNPAVGVFTADAHTRALCGYIKSMLCDTPCNPARTR